MTKLPHGAGWGCKISSTDLAQLLQFIPRSADPLVGAKTSDDAAVHRINAEQAAVFTLDFFTPIVDDPSQFGRHRRDYRRPARPHSRGFLIDAVKE